MSEALYIKVMVGLSIITIGVLIEYVNDIISRQKQPLEEEVW